MNKKMYVDVTEVCDDWGVSRAQGYKIIKQLNDCMLVINPNLIVLYKKINNLPCAIMDNITEALADTIIKKTSYAECYEYRRVGK